MTAIFTSAGLVPSFFVAEEKEIRALFRAECPTVPIGLALVAVVFEADHALSDRALRLRSLAAPTLVVHGPRPLGKAGGFDSSLETLLS
jgi:hypothetical protein